MTPLDSGTAPANARPSARRATFRTGMDKKTHVGPPDADGEGMAVTATTCVVAYLRAGDESDGDGALDRQEAIVDGHARDRGWLLAATHRDHAEGKGLFNRPGLTAAVHELEAAEPAEKRVLIVAELDRLTESPACLARLLTRAVEHGWELVALDVEMDTTTRAGRRTADTLRRVGGWTHRRISEGTKSGMARAAAQGRRPGRPRTTPDAVVHRLRALRASGLSFRDIARVLNEEGSRGSHGGRWSERTARAAYARYRTAATAA